jgi:hypothetical protein
MKEKILISVLVICLLSIMAVGQTTAGRLSGVVSSPDGVLPNATITVRDNKTGKELTFTSKEDGTFLFPQLEFGTYTVTISSTGFKTFIANEVKIDVGREFSLNPVLEIGNIQESVTVTAGADLVTSDTAQVTNTVSTEQILSLPLLTRTPLSLTTLQAGTQSNAFQETMINGMRSSFTNITRDGINIQDNYIRQNATDFAPGRPTVDDVSEFTISTSNQEADQGYGGAQIRLATPRGTKGFHGALFAYNRNSAFQANNFFNNRSSDPNLNEKPAFRNRNQFGGKIGGPLWLPHFGEGGSSMLKDRGFFFFAYEDVRDPLSIARTRTILTPSARTGIFTYNRTTAGNPINANGVSCPSGAIGSACTANILTLANALGFANTPTTISPIIQNRFISQTPAQGNTTTVGDQLNTTGFLFNRAQDATRRNYTGRIDIDINDTNTINGVYNFVNEATLRNDQDPSGFTQIPRGDVATQTKTLVLAYRRIFTPTIVNEVRGGLFFNDVKFGAFDNPALSLTLPTGLDLSNPENNSGEQGRFVKHYNFQDNLDWVLGSHSLKFGGQIQYFQPHPFDTFSIIPTATIGTSSQTPFFTCASTATCQLPGGISQAQLGTANNLLALYGGYVTGFSQQFNLVSPEEGFVGGAPNVTPFEYFVNSLYVSDRWRVTKNLTLNLGLRYEMFGPVKQTNGAALEPVITDPDNPAASLLDRNGVSNIVGGNAGSKNAFYKRDNNNFAPSIGFAYAPKFKGSIANFLLGNAFVIRGGYSHVYGNDQLVTAVSQAPSNIVGFGSRSGFAVGPNGSTQLNARLDQGLPSITAPTLNPLPPYSFIRNNTPGIGGANTNGTVFGVDPKLQTPMYKQYSFGVQREFFGNTAVEIRYVGTRSDNLLRAYNLNQVNTTNNGILADFNRALTNLSLPGATTAFCNPTTVTGCQALQIFRSSAAPTANTVGGATAGPGGLLVGTGGLSAASFNQLVRAGTPGDLVNSFFQLGFNNHPTLNNPTAVPFVNILPNPAAGTIGLLTNDGMSRYNSLQMEVRRRFTQGLYFQANYTYSKNMTNAIGGDQFYFEPYLDNARPELTLQRSDGDQTHVFNFNGVYQLPFGKGRRFLSQGGIIDKIFGGWEISGLMNLGSGAPISFVDPRGTFNTAARSARQPATSTLSTKEIQKLVGIFERDGKIYFIDPSIINPLNGRAANGFGADTFTGQVFFNNGPGETGNIPLTIINGPRYFRVDGALLKNISINERMRVQLRAEAFNLFNTVNLYNNTQVASINSTTFGQITSAGDPRVMQFAFRFEF